MKLHVNDCNVASNRCLNQPVVSPNLHSEPLLVGSAIRDVQRLGMANGSDLGCAALKRTCPSVAGQQQEILGRGYPIYPTPALHTIESTVLSLDIPVHIQAGRRWVDGS